MPNEAPQNGNQNVAALEQEVQRLRAELAAATAEAERYREAAYALLCERVPYAPPSDEELRDLLHGPRGRPIKELLNELEGGNG